MIDGGGGKYWDLCLCLLTRMNCTIKPAEQVTFHTGNIIGTKFYYFELGSSKVKLSPVIPSIGSSNKVRPPQSIKALGAKGMPI